MWSEPPAPREEQPGPWEPQYLGLDRAQPSTGCLWARQGPLSPLTPAPAPLGPMLSLHLFCRVPGNGFSPVSPKWKTPLISSSRGPHLWML